MIESVYWKEELLRISKTIRPVEKPVRFSERALCVVERDVMIGFFMLRRMIELKKVSNKTANRTLEVFSAKAIGKPVTYMNIGCFWELYDMENEKREKKKVLYISNQFIHAYASFVFRDENRNWSDIVIVSDFDKNNCIWRVPLTEIEAVFRDASNDYPWMMSAKFDPKKADYDIQVE